MQRDESRLAELGLTDGEQACLQVGVHAPEPKRFGDSEAGAREQAEERDVGLGAKSPRRREPTGSHDESLELLRREDVWRGPPMSWPENADGWDLGLGLEGDLIFGEAADDLEPPGPIERRRFGRVLSPS
jgi:hypothetical protein